MVYTTQYVEYGDHINFLEVEQERTGLRLQHQGNGHDCGTSDKQIDEAVKTLQLYSQRWFFCCPGSKEMDRLTSQNPF